MASWRVEDPAQLDLRDAVALQDGGEAAHHRLHFRQFGHGRALALDPGWLDHQVGQVGIGEVTVVVRVFF